MDLTDAPEYEVEQLSSGGDHCVVLAAKAGVCNFFILLSSLALNSSLFDWNSKLLLPVGCYLGDGGGEGEYCN